MFDGLKRAMILQGVRWAAGVIGGGVAVFAFSHAQIMAWVQQACALMSSQQAMEVGLPAFAVAVASLILGLKDNVNVNAKVVTAAATGSVKLANDPVARKTVTAASGSPEALAQAVAVLKAGQE